MPLEVEIVAGVKGEKRLDGHFADVGTRYPLASRNNLDEESKVLLA